MSELQSDLRSDLRPDLRSDTQPESQHKFATDTGVIAYTLLEPDASTGARGTAVLLHNFMSTGRAAWGSIAPTLQAEGYRVVLPDLPGHGLSRGYPPGYSHRAMAHQVADLLAAEGIERPHLAGCSAGGMMALWMVHDQRVTPETLTLVSSTYSVNPQTTGVMASLDPGTFRAGPSWLEATAKLHDVHHGEGYFDGTLLPGFRKLTTQTSIDLPLSDLAAMTMPACVIHGDQDEIFPVELAHQLAGGLPNSELHLVPGQSHALIFRQPWKVGGLLQDFLARHRLAENGFNTPSIQTPPYK